MRSSSSRRRTASGSPTRRRSQLMRADPGLRRSVERHPRRPPGGRAGQLHLVHAAHRACPVEPRALVVIGDAAHSCPPTIAQGAAQALEDAVVLTELLVARRHGGRALWDEFHARRLPRAQAVVDASVQLGQWQIDHDRDADAAGLIFGISHRMAEAQASGCPVDGCPRAPPAAWPLHAEVERRYSAGWWADAAALDLRRNGAESQAVLRADGGRARIPKLTQAGGPGRGRWMPRGSTGSGSASRRTTSTRGRTSSWAVWIAQETNRLVADHVVARARPPHRTPASCPCNTPRRRFLPAPTGSALVLCRGSRWGGDLIVRGRCRTADLAPPAALVETAEGNRRGGLPPSVRVQLGRAPRSLLSRQHRRRAGRECGRPIAPDLRRRAGPSPRPASWSSAHGGGYLPTAIGRSDHAWRVRPDAHGGADALSSDRRLASGSADRRARRAAAACAASRSRGESQVLLGSDFPFDMGLDDPVAWVRAAGLDDAVTERIVGVNAEALLPGGARA